MLQFTKGDVEYGSSNKKLPIVLCLDVSASMSYPSGLGKARYEVQNDAVEAFISSIVSVPKALASAEIAVIAFADEVWYETEFTPIRSLSFPKCSKEGLDVSYKQASATYEKNNRAEVVSYHTPLFKHVPGQLGGTMYPTSLCPAINRAIKKIDKWLLEKGSNPHYAPFIIFSTDCDQQNGMIDNAFEKQATKELIRKHLNAPKPENSIIPFFIGIGSDCCKSDLRGYAGDFEDGCIILDNLKNFVNLFRCIADCIAKTMTYVESREQNKSILDAIRDIIEDWDELS